MTTLYNTYWVRFQHGETDFDQAIAQSRALFDAARRAGVTRIVHVSITNPSLACDLPYFRGKAQTEQALAETGVSFGIVRPTVVFGPGDVLINNIAWLLRHLPVFAIAGDGEYRVRPVHVDDVARACASRWAIGPTMRSSTRSDPRCSRSPASSRRWVTPSAGGPDSCISRRPRSPALARVLGVGLRDALLTRDELAGLMRGLVTTDGPSTGLIDLRDWLGEHGATLGRTYTSRSPATSTGPKAPSPRPLRGHKRSNDLAGDEEQEAGDGRGVAVFLRLGEEAFGRHRAPPCARPAGRCAPSR